MGIFHPSPTVRSLGTFSFAKIRYKDWGIWEVQEHVQLEVIQGEMNRTKNLQYLMLDSEEPRSSVYGFRYRRGRVLKLSSKAADEEGEKEEGSHGVYLKVFKTPLTG